MNKSFTLIEILVVIVVIGVLSAFILVGMSSITSKASIAKGQVFVNSFNNTLLLARVSQWKLDSNGNDFWGSNTGAVNGASVSSDCIQDTCYSFNGNTDYINCGSGASLTTNLNAWTISAWVKPTNLNVNTLIGFYDTTSRPSIRLNNTWGAPIIFMGNSNFRYFSTSAWTTLINGAWHNVVFSIPGNGQTDINNSKMYLDSQEVSVYSTTANDVPNAKVVFHIGRADTYYYGGLIDDVRVYNQVIPTSQIKQNYFAGINRLLVKDNIESQEYSIRINQLASN